LLTGTDEHGQKDRRVGKKEGERYKAYTDEISAKFRELWDSFEISYDKFIRTTDDYHMKGVKRHSPLCMIEEIYIKMYIGGTTVSPVRHSLQIHSL